jgi:tetratricopeptide (TPR) repeat protein
MMAAGALALRFVWKVLSAADTAGFAVPGFTWHQYFFTQCRVIWIYLRLFLLPFGQTIDYDLAASRSLLDPAAIAGLAGLLAAAAAAVFLRRRYPLGSYGLLAFLLLLAPTSSVVPILDPIAERRVYLPLLGLLLVTLEVLRRLKTRPARLAAALAVLLMVAGALTYHRNRVWGSDIALWEDAVARSPRKSRVHFQLGFAYFRVGRCEDAERHYEIASRLAAPDFRLYYNWAMAYTCLGRAGEARQKLLATIEDCQRHLRQHPGDQATRQILRMAEERLGLAR